MLPAYWPVCKFDLILPVLFLAAFLTYWPPSLLLLAPVSMCTYCLPNPRSFCQIHCSLSCAVLPCALVKYLFNRMAYDEEKKLFAWSSFVASYEKFQMIESRWLCLVLMLPNLKVIKKIKHFWEGVKVWFSSRKTVETSFVFAQEFIC